MVYTEFIDYYALLNISFTSSDKDIKAAYRKLARENHPDMHPDDSGFYTEKFKEITAAYETLSQPMKKGIYDLRYRQIILQEFPQYEDVVDTTPADTTHYAHKYTRRSKRKVPYYALIAFLILAFQILRMISGSAPLEKPVDYNNAGRNISDFRNRDEDQNKGVVYPYGTTVGEQAVYYRVDTSH